jgi:predicted nucleic acid-binding protein
MEARMADRFFDTSAFAKHYRTELGSVKIDAFLAETGSRHFISALGVVELHSILARLVRIASGLWEVMPVTAARFYHAQQLLIRHSLVRSLRTLDAVQLAVALLHTTPSLGTFVCADINLCQVAAAEGLTVVNPEVP